MKRNKKLIPQVRPKKSRPRSAKIYQKSVQMETQPPTISFFQSKDIHQSSIYPSHQINHLEFRNEIPEALQFHIPATEQRTTQ